MSSLLIVLLPLAALSGWHMAMRSEARALRQNRARASYFQGLYYLLNDESDRALEAFSRLPELDQQTIDSQLILGNLFRKRGELDRALHLHQRLYQDERLSPEQRWAVAYELAEDYHQAGMYVQAQELYEALLVAGHRSEEVRAVLARIYERLALWQKAIALAVAAPEQMAHYYCSLAEQDAEQSAFYLRRALECDLRCVRAHWLQAQQWAAQQDWIQVIAALQFVLRLAPHWLPEALPLLLQAYAALQRRDEGLRWLLEEDARQNSTRLSLAILPHLPPEEASNWLRQRFQESASPLLLSHFLPGDYPAALRQDLRPQTLYQCQQCGFRHQKLIWHCPACFSWSSFWPIFELKHQERRP